MSLIDKASLIQIPSGYKSTKLYSIEPTNGDGDFTFARSSSATRVNSEGLIEVASVLGSELVTNGDFATDSDWSSTEVATIGISGGSINFSSTSSNKRIENIGSIIVGKKYIVNYDIVSISEGSFAFQDGVSTYTYRSSIGSYSEEITASGTFIRIRTAGTTTGSIDNVSVKEVIENDVPRLDYSGGASCASLLLEGQRTNTMLHSELFTDSVYSRTSMSLESSPSGVSPDGTTNAFKVNPSVNGSSSFMFQSSTLTGSNMTQSIFVKSNSSTGRFVQLTGSSGVSNQNHVNFDLLNGTIYDSIGTFNAFIEDYGSGWYRIGVTSNTSATIGRFIFTIVSSLSSGRLSGAGVTTDMEFYIYGYQLENGAYKTSYIPTTTASATRTADVCNNAGTSATFNDSEGVLFAEIAALYDDLTTNRGIAISDGTSSNRVLIYYSNDSNQINAIYTYNGTTQVNITKVLSDSTQFTKFAFKYKENDCAFWIDGVEVGADNTATAFAADTLDTLNFDSGAGGSDFYGKTKQLMVFNEALSDEELADLTGAVHQTFNSLATFYGYTIL